MNFKRTESYITANGTREMKKKTKTKKTPSHRIKEWQTFFNLRERSATEENKLREFQFTFLHRIVFTKRNSFVLEFNRTVIAYFAAKRIP